MSQEQPYPRADELGKLFHDLMSLFSAMNILLEDFGKMDLRSQVMKNLIGLTEDKIAELTPVMRDIARDFPTPESWIPKD